MHSDHYIYIHTLRPLTIMYTLKPLSVYIMVQLYITRPLYIYIYIYIHEITLLYHHIRTIRTLYIYNYTINLHPFRLHQDR